MSFEIISFDARRYRESQTSRNNSESDSKSDCNSEFSVDKYPGAILLVIKK